MYNKLRRMSWHPPGRSDTPLLKPEELFEKRRTRDASRLRAYNTILEQIYFLDTIEGFDEITYYIRTYILYNQL